MLTRPSIVLDVDDVLFPFCEAIHPVIQDAGLCNDQGPPSQWDLAAHYGSPASELWDCITDAYSDGLLMQPPFEHVPEMLDVLREMGASLHIVTARGCFRNGLSEQDQLVREQTREWLDLYDVPHDTVSFARDKTGPALRYEADYALDDNPDHVQSLMDIGVEAFLADQPHNQWAEHLEAVRVDGLAHFIAVVDRELTTMAGV